MVKTRDSPPRDSPTRPIKNIARKTDLNKLGPALKTKIELDSALPISDSSNQLSWRDARMESETEFSIAEPAKRRRIESTERELIKRDSTCSYSSSNSSDGISNYESCDEGEQSDTLETSPSENYTLEQFATNSPKPPPPLNRHPSVARERLASVDSLSSSPSTPNYPKLQRNSKHSRTISLQGQVENSPINTVLPLHSTVSPRSSIRLSLTSSPKSSYQPRNSQSSFKLKPLVLTSSRTVTSPLVSPTNRPSSALGHSLPPRCSSAASNHNYPPQRRSLGYFESGNGSKRTSSQSTERSFSSRRTNGSVSGSPNSSLSGWEDERSSEVGDRERREEFDGGRNQFEDLEETLEDQEEEGTVPTYERIRASYPSFQTFDREFINRPINPTIAVIEASPIGVDIRAPSSRLSEELLASSKTLVLLSRSDSSQSTPPTPPPTFPLPGIPSITNSPAVRITSAGKFEESSLESSFVAPQSKGRAFRFKTGSKLFSKSYSNPISPLEVEELKLKLKKSDRSSNLPAIAWPSLDAPTIKISAGRKASLSRNNSTGSEFRTELERNEEESEFEEDLSEIIIEREDLVAREPREARGTFRSTLQSQDTILHTILMNGPDSEITLNEDDGDSDELIISNPQENKKRWGFFKNTKTSIKSINSSSNSRLSSSVRTNNLSLRENVSTSSLLTRSSGGEEHILDFIAQSPQSETISLPPVSGAYSSANRGGSRRLELKYPVLTSGKRGSIFPSRVSKR